MTRLRIPTSWRQTSWLVAKKLNSGLTEQNPLVVRTGFEPVTYGFQIRCFNHLAKLPSYIILRLLYTEQAV